MGWSCEVLVGLVAVEHAKAPGRQDHGTRDDLGSARLDLQVVERLRLRSRNSLSGIRISSVISYSSLVIMCYEDAHS